MSQAVFRAQVRLSNKEGERKTTLNEEYLEAESVLSEVFLGKQSTELFQVMQVNVRN